MKYENGFSLIELLIVSAVMLVVLLAFFSIYFASQGFYQKAENQAEILQNGRVILERISREVRQAKEVVTSLSNLESEAANSFVFEDGHVTSPYSYIRYFQDGSLIKREVFGYYFSGDALQELVPWNAAPPGGQTLEEKVIESEKTIGEYIQSLKIWRGDAINVKLELFLRGEIVNLESSFSPRNL